MFITYQRTFKFVNSISITTGTTIQIPIQPPFLNTQYGSEHLHSSNLTHFILTKPTVHFMYKQCNRKRFRYFDKRLSQLTRKVSSTSVSSSVVTFPDCQ